MSEQIIRQVFEKNGTLANNIDGDCTFYEVWGKGTGAESNSSVLLHSIVKACES